MWHEVKRTLEGNSIELEYLNILNNPRNVCQKIATYLDLDAGEEALMLDYLESQRPVSSVNTNIRDYIGLYSTEWSESQKQEFISICVPIGKLFGYGINKYFSEDE